VKISLLCKTETELHDWSRFVINHPDGNFFQSPDLFNIYHNTKNHKPICIIGKDSDGNILAILLAVIIKNFKWGLENYTTRSIIQGGPLILEDNPTHFIKIINYYEKFIKDKVVYTQYRNMKNMLAYKPVFTEHKYSYEEHLNIIIDLNKSREKLWKEMNGKRRNSIRKAMKSNIIIKIKNDIKSVKNSYRVLKSVYRNAKIPLADESFFLSLFYNNNDNYKAINFCAVYDNKIIGCMIVIAYKNRVYDLYAGSERKHYKKNPNDLIPWTVMLWSKENNYKIFDFGGAGKPNKEYGVRDYKKKFGGNLVNYGRLQKIHQPRNYKLAKFVYSLIK
tara:strand:+ start:5756 stop:6757 length:1002 start_codon:yes stop_codon:yes gene_type:complete